MVAMKFWQEKLRKIYPNTDKSPDYIMAHVYTACSELGRYLLRNENNDRRDEAVLKAISWMMALSTHFKLDFESAVVRRFPLACPYCLDRPCTCDRTGKRAKRHGRLLSSNEVKDELSAKYNGLVFSTEASFSWLAGQLAEIYPSNRALLTKGGQGYIAAKLLEEGGELHRAYSVVLLGRGDPADIGREVADLTAWVISCWDLDGAGKNIDAEVASTYVDGCYRCHKSPCVCPTYSITMGQEELIGDIAKYLRALKTAGVQPKAVDEALASVDEVASAPTKKTKTTAAQKVKALMSVLTGAERGLETVDGVVQHLSDAVEHLEHLV